MSAGKHQIIADIEADISLLARERELYQALSNLVFNAVRHAGEGCQIHIGLQRIANPNPYKPPLVQFSVRDTGKGIAPEHLPHLTDRFYRADSGRSRENGGTGLGLAIAKHALANHQASLHIRSELGVGSEFMTQLPT
ncbi:ATP-binding protein [Kingella kingae]|nr:ATP-binding protein [Kingella kingae]